MASSIVVGDVVKSLRNNFNKRTTIDFNFRINQLNILKKMLEDNRDELVEIIRKDFKKPIFEVMYELDYSISNIDYTLKCIQSWSSPENIPKNFINTINPVQIHRQPLGVVLIITPWNYPILLFIVSLVGAIAAGNCVLIKPSEICPNISTKLAELVEQSLNNDYYRVICGGVDVATNVLKERFDHILYIGSVSVGKIVMEAAAKHLTPVTLELGGKCPCYVDKQCDIELAAKKVAWAKTVNVGQICMSIDYVLCHKDVYHKFIELVKSNWIAFYGDDPSVSTDYGRIINRNHFKRVINLLNSSKGNIFVGGQNNEDDCYIAPTLLIDIDKNDPIMEHEIFGPILPVIIVDDNDQAIEIINQIPSPLTVYVMTSSNEIIEKFDKQTTSGSLIINDAYMQLSLKDLPIGGVGDSGMGRYFGKETFKIFSNPKSFYHKKYYTQQYENVPLPPMTQRRYNLMKWNT